MSAAIKLLGHIGAVTRLSGRTFKIVFSRRFVDRSLLSAQMDQAGIGSWSIAVLTALFTGAVMAIQFADGLEPYGASLYTGKMVSLGIVRELGPTLTAVLVGGRVGAGFTAEIGSMNVTEQVDAISALGADPIEKLVAPRVLACIIMLTTMGRVFGTLRGGLAFSVIAVGALLAASTGVVGATVVTMGLISLPAMLRAGYDPKLACGVICASGTLGQIIPPSTVLIFMGDMLAGINAQVQMAKGNFAPTPVSVGDLFAGAMIPGLLLVGLYFLYALWKAIFDPKSCPAMVVTDAERAALGRDVLTALLPPLLLIITVLGSILGGIATPTESASVGAVGAVILAAVKRRFNLKTLREATLNTATVTSMVFVILLGAAVFSIVFRMMGGDNLVHSILSDLPGGAMGALIIVMFVMFLLGFILDTFEIIFIVIPITAPVLLNLGVDPLWLGVLVGVNLQTSFLTPPFGFSLFYLRGVAPAEVTTGQIYRGVVPIVALQVVELSSRSPDHRLSDRGARAPSFAGGDIGGAVARGDALPGELALRPLARGFAVLREAPPICQGFRQYPDEVGDAVLRHQPAVDALGDRRRQTRDPRTDDRQTGRHRLQDHVGQSIDIALGIVHRRQHEQIGGAIEVGQRVVQHGAREVHPASEDRSSAAEFVEPIAAAREHEMRFRQRGEQRR